MFHNFQLSLIFFFSFDDDISQALKEAREIPYSEFKEFNFNPQNSYRVVYNGTREWVDLAKYIGIMSDIRVCLFLLFFKI